MFQMARYEAVDKEITSHYLSFEDVLTDNAARESQAWTTDGVIFLCIYNIIF